MIVWACPTVGLDANSTTASATAAPLKIASRPATTPCDTSEHRLQKTDRFMVFSKFIDCEN
jgi:hypothetical protein